MKFVVRADLLHLLTDLSGLHLPKPPQPAAIGKARRHLERQGQTKPVHVATWGGKRLVMDGSEQVQAARQLGWSSIAVVVETPPGNVTGH